MTAGSIFPRGMCVGSLTAHSGIAWCVMLDASSSLGCINVWLASYNCNTYSSWTLWSLNFRNSRTFLISWRGVHPARFCSTTYSILASCPSTPSHETTTKGRLLRRIPPFAFYYVRNCKVRTRFWCGKNDSCGNVGRTGQLIRLDCLNLLVLSNSKLIGGWQMRT